MRESKIEKHFKDEVQRIGGLSYKFVSPNNRGVSDQIAIWPDGKVSFVELKSPTGRRSALQMEFENEVRELGHDYMTCFGIADVNAFIRDVERKMIYGWD